MTDLTDVTLVKGAIHNPDEPRHFMRIVPAATRHTARVGDQVLADSTEAVVVKEVGRDIYDPVVYFPRADVEMGLLSVIDKSTFCPLKGHTEYFDFTPTTGDSVGEVAWSYTEMVAGHELLELVAFDSAKVTIS